MRNLEKLSAAEIEDTLIADANDDTLWEQPVKVRASKSPRPNWYGQDGTPIAITLTGSEMEDAQNLYHFLASGLSEATAYGRRRQTSVGGSWVDFYLVLGAAASIASIANVLWTAYDRLIARQKDKGGKAPSIQLVVQQNDGVINLNLANISDTQEFIEQLTIFVDQATQPDAEIARKAIIHELEKSGSWVKLNNKRR